MNYFRGKNYLEVKKTMCQIYNILFASVVWSLTRRCPQLGVDIGSSSVARGVVGLVLGYLNNLVIEMAFLIQVVFGWTTRVYVSCKRLHDADACSAQCLRRFSGKHTRGAAGDAARDLPAEPSRCSKGCAYWFNLQQQQELDKICKWFGFGKHHKFDSCIVLILLPSSHQLERIRVDNFLSPFIWWWRNG